MTAALDRPTVASVFTAWTPQPLALAAVAALALTYAYGVRRLDRPWPRGRTATFALGLALLLYTTCGAPGVYGPALFWVWMAQGLVLWLVVPFLLLFGHPVQLARAVTGPGRWPDRVLDSAPIRVISKPLVSPALVPILSFVVFFGPVPGWAVGVPVFGWVLQLVLVALGAAMALWLVGIDEDRVTTLSAGFALGLGMFELVVDAVPGIVMRLKDNLVTTFFDERSPFAGQPDALSDQRRAGAVLWFIAELIDLPFLVLAYRRWRRIDAKDAAHIDAVLEAERAARGAETDEPWWLSDPAMRERLKKQR
ncbi:cytochrome c oxidase assembly protein [Jatrophihabitans fulvus]